MILDLTDDEARRALPQKWGSVEPGVADPAAVALEHSVRPAPGNSFQPGLEGHVRLNAATSPARLTTMIERLASALTDDVA